METSKDRVLKAINHIQPETTPVHIMGFESLDKWLERFGAKDDFDIRNKLGLDLQAAPAVYVGPNAKRGLTIWGTDPNVVGSDGFGFSKVRDCYPLSMASSLADIECFAWPNANDFNYEIVAKILRSVPDKARYVRPAYVIHKEGFTEEEGARSGGRMLAMRGSGGWLPLLCTLFELFGMEKTLINLNKKPDIIHATIAHIEDFLLEFSRRLLETTKGLIDIYWYGDDFASQRGMMISPEHWRKFLKPTYKKVFELGKRYGLKTWFHSCGTFRPVLPDLIDIGMDVWETVQTHLPGNEPEVLKQEYGRDITFYGGINSQRTLPFGTVDEVRAEVRDRIRVLGQGGGYICGPDHTVLPDVPIENVLALLDEAQKCNP